GALIAVFCVIVVIAGVLVSLPEERADSAEFKLSNLSVTPSEVEKGQTVTVTVDVQNTGGMRGTETVKFRIDGEVVTREVTLQAGEVGRISFDFEAELEGAYDVEVAGLSQSFMVVEKLATIEIHFMDVGQADATLLLTPEVTMLVDAGHWQRRDVIGYLQDQGVEEIDLLVATHAHADHIGQMREVIEDFMVHEVWMSGDLHSSDTFEGVVGAIEQSDVGYVEPRAGEVYGMGDLRIEVLHPEELTGDLHEGCLAFRVVFDEFQVMFTGDLEEEMEMKIMERNLELDADVYQVGHHGSQTSSSEEFLLEVDPEVAVYSAGEDNSYGHPHQEVIDRMNNMDITVYGTDIHGTIIITGDTSGYFTVDTEYETDPLVSSNFITRFQLIRG
ncbi:MAG: MBL fold metallo-hydrolase, partial [Thermoproteota archaeon]